MHKPILCFWTLQAGTIGHVAHGNSTAVKAISGLQGTIAQGAPVVPISAQLKYNIDVICEYIMKKIPIPWRHFTSPPNIIVIHSFDVNKHGSEVNEIRARAACKPGGDHGADDEIGRREGCKPPRPSKLVLFVMQGQVQEIAVDESFSSLYKISQIREYMITLKQRLVILYRNGNFHVIHVVFHKGTLHILQTEVSIQKKFPNAAWKILHDVDGNGLLVTDEFNAINNDDVSKVKELYDEGINRPDQIAKRHADELLASIEKEKEDKAIKAQKKVEAKAIKKEKKDKATKSQRKVEAQEIKKKHPFDGNSSVSNTEHRSTVSEVESIEVIFEPVADRPKEPSAPPDEKAEATEATFEPAADPSKEPSAPPDEKADSTEAVFEPTADPPKEPSAPPDEKSESTEATFEPAADLPQKQSALDSEEERNESWAFKKLLNFLHRFDNDGKCKDYYKHDVELMNRRGDYSLVMLYSHIERSCNELAVHLRDSRVRVDLNGCLAEYLIAQGVEEDKARQAILRMHGIPKGYESFADFARRNNLTECHELYMMVPTLSPSKIGRRAGRRYLKYIIEMHKRGRSWNGQWNENEMKVCHDGSEFIIDAEAKYDASKEAMEADFQRFYELVSPYFEDEVTDPATGEKRRELPSYFTQFEADCKKVPDPDSEPRMLKRFQMFMGCHPAFMDPLAISTFVCNMLTLTTATLDPKKQDMYTPLNVERSMIWRPVNLQHPIPFHKVYNHRPANYESGSGYWFLLKFLRNFLQHVQVSLVLDIDTRSLMIGHYMSYFVSNLILFIVQNLSIDRLFSTAWTHYEESQPTKQLITCYFALLLTYIMNVIGLHFREG
ncbi:hypothetical protein EJB05_06048 [Eragrostis curvula]|uniref:Uncharacterized protein n=1 Tax=Eragrostis curvula TaxID=38414 RepID=A0A5J9WF49_9POAL|nr:hypothetical protein EJB05_06048 [Eragrostis curvula]